MIYGQKERAIGGAKETESVRQTETGIGHGRTKFGSWGKRRQDINIEPIAGEIKARYFLAKMIGGWGRGGRQDRRLREKKREDP